MNVFVVGQRVIYGNIRSVWASGKVTHIEDEDYVSVSWDVLRSTDVCHVDNLRPEVLISASIAERI